jgi:glyoxylase-like metal-dependent hydrolase (beta-lactamase superfamily II)
MNERMIGNVRVTRIEELLGPGFPAPAFFPDYNAEEFERQLGWLAPRYYEKESGRLVSSIHSWLVRTPHQVILIDACSGNDKERPGMPRFDRLDTPYLDRLRAAGVAPEEVDLVLCTHLHVDHVGWNTRLENGRWVPTFPRAKYLMSRIEHQFWSDAAAAPDADLLVRNVYSDSVLPVVESGKSVMIDGAHDLDNGLVIQPAPGHTPGQYRVDLASGGRAAIFSGDALHNPVQVPLWRWNSCFCEDREQARATRHELLSQCAERRALLLPAHFAEPYAGYVTARGDGFELAFDWDGK